MLEIQGQYNTAKVFTDNIEQKAVSQIYNLLNQSFVTGSKIRIMPDVHAGMGSTVGTTLTISDRIAPGLVGVDIGCGMETAILRESEIDLEQLDSAIHQHVPSGIKVRKDTHRLGLDFDLKALRCAKHIDMKRAWLSIGTLGGGNHFIELGKGNEDWNNSAPHGAGRLLSRGTAKESYTLAQYEEAMSGIFSSSISKRTLDEAPFAYKSTDEIIAKIGDTVDILKTIKPIYNFKAGI